MPQVSLTTDIGEGLGRWKLGDDEALLGIVSAANVACGFHGGDPNVMRETCSIAVKNGVSIGAQVSYRDIHGFGRRFIDYEQEDLTNDLLYQMGALEVFARLAGGKINFVRAHGALYNATAKVTKHAQALVDATREYDANLPLLCQENTETWRTAQKAGIRTISEAFVDRAYTPEGLLLPRTEKNALYSDPEAAAKRAVIIATTGEIKAIDGTPIHVKAEALLVHCDTPGAVTVARRARQALEDAGIDVVPVK